MIAKIAVSAANFAIDKPYSYYFSEAMQILPGMRVVVPFGRSNRATEGVVLTVEEGTADGLKPILHTMDDTPVLSGTMLRLASFMKERYFCTFFDAARAMLPAGLWFQRKDTYALTQDRSWEDKPIKQADGKLLLQTLVDCGGSADGSALDFYFEDQLIVSAPLSAGFTHLSIGSATSSAFPLTVEYVRIYPTI
jgi:primosomal protein N' (replication factor Y)